MKLESNQSSIRVGDALLAHVLENRKRLAAAPDAEDLYGALAALGIEAKSNKWMDLLHLRLPETTMGKLLASLDWLSTVLPEPQLDAAAQFRGLLEARRIAEAVDSFRDADGCRREGLLQVLQTSDGLECDEWQSLLEGLEAAPPPVTFDDDPSLVPFFADDALSQRAAVLCLRLERLGVTEADLAVLADSENRHERLALVYGMAGRPDEFRRWCSRLAQDDDPEVQAAWHLVHSLQNRPDSASVVAALGQPGFASLVREWGGNGGEAYGFFDQLPVTLIDRQGIAVPWLETGRALHDQCDVAQIAATWEHDPDWLFQAMGLDGNQVCQIVSWGKSWRWYRAALFGQLAARSPAARQRWLLWLAQDCTDKDFDLSAAVSSLFIPLTDEAIRWRRSLSDEGTRRELPEAAFPQLIALATRWQSLEPIMAMAVSSQPFRQWLANQGEALGLLLTRTGSDEALAALAALLPQAGAPMPDSLLTISRILAGGVEPLPLAELEPFVDIDTEWPLRKRAWARIRAEDATDAFLEQRFLEWLTLGEWRPMLDLFDLLVRLVRDAFLTEGRIRELVGMMGEPGDIWNRFPALAVAINRANLSADFLEELSATLRDHPDPEARGPEGWKVC
jgi:hypothetical protein